MCSACNVCVVKFQGIWETTRKISGKDSHNQMQHAYYFWMLVLTIIESITNDNTELMMFKFVQPCDYSPNQICLCY